MVPDSGAAEVAAPGWTAPRRRPAESIRYKDSPRTVALYQRVVRRRREYNRKGQLKSKQNLLLTFGADSFSATCYLDLACTRDMTHGCLLPLLPALLRSPFRLRDILTRSSDPQIEIALFFRAWSRAGTRPTPPKVIRVQRGRDYGATTSLVWLKIPYDKSESYS